MKLLIMQYSAGSLQFLPLTLKYSSQRPVFKHHQFMFTKQLLELWFSVY